MSLSALTHPRVLQVALSLNPGGTERLVIELTARLHPTMPMAVCCLDERGTWAASLEELGITVHALGRQPGFHPSLGMAIARVARAHRATMIHAHHYSPFVYAAVARLCGAGSEVIFTEHGRLSDTRPSAKRRLANRLLGRIPKRVFTVSGDLRQHLIEEGFSPDAVDVIYNGIDAGPLPDPHTRAQARARLRVTPDTLVVGTIARLDPVKNLGSLIRAAALVAGDRPIVVLIIGDGPERAALERLTAELDAGHLIRFEGHKDDARSWLAGWDVFVNCSVSEGVSLTILEAMAAGLPVIATGVGGTPEVVNSTCGRLVPARDDAALASMLLELALARDLRVALGTAGRARMEQHFSLARMVDDYRVVYTGGA